MYPDDAECYVMLRDAIIDELDPPDDDIAEVAILIDAVKKVKQERDQLQARAQALIERIEYAIDTLDKVGEFENMHIAARYILKDGVDEFNGIEIAY